MSLPFHGASMWVGMGSVLTIARWGVQQWNGGEGPRQGTGANSMTSQRLLGTGFR